MKVLLFSLFVISSQALPYLPILVGYMNLQSTTHNACQIDGSHVENQLALGSNIFDPTLCGQQVSVVIGGTTMNGVVIDALDSSNRIMVSPNMFERVASLDTGIVQGSLLLPDRQNVASYSEPSNATTSLSSMTQLYALSASPFEKEKQVGTIPTAQDQTPLDISDGYQHILYQSNPADSNDITFYYDINGAGPCGPVNGIASFSETNGYAACEPSAGYQTLKERNTNNIVAIPVSLLSQNKASFCGKRVVATVNGVERNDLNLVIWDSCVANDARGNGGLDVSSTIFADLVGTDRCGEGRIKNELSWRIVDDQLIDWHE
jgi:hypothetical protein